MHLRIAMLASLLLGATGCWPFVWDFGYGQSDVAERADTAFREHTVTAIATDESSASASDAITLWVAVGPIATIDSFTATIDYQDDGTDTTYSQTNCGQDDCSCTETITGENLDPEQMSAAGRALTFSGAIDVFPTTCTWTTAWRPSGLAYLTVWFQDESRTTVTQWITHEGSEPEGIFSSQNQLGTVGNAPFCVSCGSFSYTGSAPVNLGPLHVDYQLDATYTPAGPP